MGFVCFMKMLKEEVKQKKSGLCWLDCGVKERKKHNALRQ